jgi:alginate O-acetyltransferase complex protein AlgJ
LASRLESQREYFVEDDLPQESLSLRGWIILSSKLKPRLVAEYREYCQEFELTHRSDVKSVYKDRFNGEDILCLGYNCMVEDIASMISLRILHYCKKEEITEECIFVIERCRIIKPLAGANGWLYLDNDTNKSVDQFTGKHNLSCKHILKWESFLSESSSLLDRLDSEWRFLVAPAKEYVTDFLYPYCKSDVTPLSQLDDLLDSHYPGKRIDCIQHLKANWPVSYSMTDTHWTDIGAYLIASLIADSFGLCTKRMPQSLESATFNFVEYSGDLGSKLCPPILCYVPVLIQDSIPVRKTFDNGVHNHGRIWIFENSEISSSSKCIVFGDSFSINLVPWLACLYSRVVYCHTSAGVDISVLKHESPCNVVLQTNSRFVGVVPSASYSLVDVSRGKGYQGSSLMYF